MAATGDNAERVADMRSDTITQPCAAMRAAMAGAEVGDDVFGDDPTVKQLESRVAELLGKPAAVYVPSGTMGNLLAIGTHCTGRGEEVLCGKESHIWYYEQGGASSLMGVVYHTLPNNDDGTIDLDDVRKATRYRDQHLSVARLLTLENTHNRLGGRVIGVEYMKKAGALCKELGLALHVDGARLWHAAIALGVPPAALLADADSASVCLSKGLGAPVGSVLVGSTDFIRRARHLRKAVGGSMRQVGVIAAAGLYAVNNNLSRVADDHANAARLAAGLTRLGLRVITPESNIVVVDVPPSIPATGPELVRRLDAAGVRLLDVNGKDRFRAIPNLHVTAADIDRAIEIVRAALDEITVPEIVRAARGALTNGTPPAKRAKAE